MPSANRYTTTELLSDIRRKGHIPSNQTPFLDADLLAIADQDLQTSLLRQILSARENYFLVPYDQAITSDSSYLIPPRSIGGGLSAVQILVGTTIYSVSRSEISEQFSTITSPTGFYAFYLQGNSFVLRPNPTTGTIRSWYYLRPNTMVTIASAAQITGIAGNVLTFSSLPATVTTTSALDIIKDQPGFDLLVMDSTPTAVTTTTVTLSSVPSTVVVGDWVALAGQTPVPQIPVEFRPLLVQRVVVKYYEIQGYIDKMKAAQAKLEEMTRDVFELINPRVTEAPKRIVADSSLIGGSSQWRKWRAT